MSYQINNHQQKKLKLPATIVPDLIQFSTFVPTLISIKKKKKNRIILPCTLPKKLIWTSKSMKRASVFRGCFFTLFLKSSEVFFRLHCLFKDVSVTTGDVEKREGRVNRVSGGTSGSAGLRRLAFPVQRPSPRSTTGPDPLPGRAPLASNQKPPSGAAHPSVIRRSLIKISILIVQDLLDEKKLVRGETFHCCKCEQ